jgi:hypothetical protein
MSLLGPALGWVIVSLAAIPSDTALVLIEDGRTPYRIIVSARPAEADFQAAQKLQAYLRKMTGVVVPLDADASPVREEEILVGPSERLSRTGVDIPWEKLGDDGFVLKTSGRRLVIAGGKDRGTLYGVTTFLEDILGCRKYSASSSSIPTRPTVVVGPLDRMEIPAFDYREAYMPDAFDEGFAAWHKLDNRAVQAREWGLWVHTFEVFVPAAKHFDSHPEYFTQWKGLRVPNGQLCLSNPDVLRIVVRELAERIRDQPGPRYWSVSQNDTFLPCQCDSCLALEAKYGGPSGAVLWFVNQVARAFPDKVISTLAYQYSRSAPRNIVPEPNVNIMLCTIELNRSRPIASDPGSVGFLRDLKDWSRLTRNIILWDYVVQFRNYADPFPNLRVLQPNLKLFAQAGVKLVFEQGSGRSRSEFHELRTYLLAKLLWNPEADVDALTADFVHGYYGPAGPEILAYIQACHDALDRSGGELGIYGSPRDGLRTYLTPELLDRYEALFDRAEAAAGVDPELKRRVRSARLPVAYARLELAKLQATPSLSVFERTGDGFRVRPEIRTRLDAFVEAAGQTGFQALDERGLSPAQYRAEMERYFEDGAVSHLARGAAVSCLSGPSDKYPVGGPSALTDGLKGTDDYSFNWAGFEGEEMVATVDLGEVKSLSAIRSDFLQDPNAWVWVPREVVFSASSDGADFREVGLARAALDPKRDGAFIQTFAAAAPRGFRARFIKVTTKSFLLCPPWHKGAGGKAWIFTDEIVVD